MNLRGLGLGSVGPGSWMMISLLADVTRHLTIATLIVHFISCCLPRLLGYYTTIETSLFLMYMLNSSNTVSCAANSDGVDDVRGAPSNPPNKATFQARARRPYSSITWGLCGSSEVNSAHFTFFCDDPPVFPLGLFVAAACV
jgi:hypothetical protein